MPINLPELPDIPDWKTWEKSTKLSFGRRSPALKELDQSIKNFEKTKTDANRNVVKDKLLKWQRSKGSGRAWQQSSRNKTQAITKIDELLNGIIQPQDSYGKNLAHARLGVIYLLGNTQVDTNYVNFALDAGASLTGSFLGGVGDPSKSDPSLISNQSTAAYDRATAIGHGIKFGTKPVRAITDAIETNVHAARGLEGENARQHSAFQRLVIWLEDFIRKLCKQLRASVVKRQCRYGPEELNWEQIISAAKNLIILGAKKVWESAAPFIGSGVDLFKGLVNVSDAAVTSIANWWRSIGVDILAGHPSAITAALHKAMKGAVLGGLYDTMKASIGIAIQALLPAAGSVVNSVIDIVTKVFETIYNFVTRRRNLSSMRAAFSQANTYWGEYAAYEKSIKDNPRPPPPPLFFHERPADFGQWYREVAIYTPEVAALTLNSGICGDAMHFLNMFDKNDDVISQKKFSAGVNYRNRLKSYSAEFLRKSPYIFHSSSDQVNGHIALAKGFAMNSGSSAWQGVKTLANA